MHESKHPRAGETVKVKLRGIVPAMPGGEDLVNEIVIEDWGDRVLETSIIMTAPKGFAHLNYNARVMASFYDGDNPIPVDDEVVYGKSYHSGQGIGLGYLVHVSEITD